MTLSSSNDIKSQHFPIAGQSPAWQSGQVQPTLSVQPSAAETAQKDRKPKKNKEAPSPFENDFPDLGPSQGPILSELSSSKNGAKKKNKKNPDHSGGFMIGDEPITASRPTSSGARGWNL